MRNPNLSMPQMVAPDSRSKDRGKSNMQGIPPNMQRYTLSTGEAGYFGHPTGQLGPTVEFADHVDVQEAKHCLDLKQKINRKWYSCDYTAKDIGIGIVRGLVVIGAIALMGACSVFLIGQGW